MRDEKCKVGIRGGDGMRRDESLVSVNGPGGGG